MRVSVHRNGHMAVTGINGDIGGGPGTGDGMYFRDCRHLTCLVLTESGRPTVPGWWTVDERGCAVSRPRFDHLPDLDVVRETHPGRPVVHEICLHNRGASALALDLAIELAADFADMFEVRGHASGPPRACRRSMAGPERIALSYAAADGLVSCTEVAVGPGVEWAGDRARRQVELAPGQQLRWRIEVTMSRSDLTAGAAVADREGGWPRLETDNPDLDRIWRRAISDIEALTVFAEPGAYLVAGLPWYAVPFGRDALLAAHLLLKIEPRLAEGTLRFLAAHQATRFDRPSNAEPGKILHEFRDGELARTGALPFRPYFGSVDVTPLFLVLLADHATHTGDLTLVEELRPAWTAALEWIDWWGDGDGDWFVEHGTGALVNQGWKDSGDALDTASGRPEGPIALAEVQAYVYRAKRGVARLLRLTGEESFAARLELAADSLRQRFETAFWVDALDCCAIALDGHKQPVAVVSSNAGQLLWGGLPSAATAARLARRMSRPDMLSGWGIRTRSAADPLYDPLSYHNGSIWPHDNALIAAGLAASGWRELATEVATQVLEAGARLDGDRLPELYGGHPRQAGPPVRYPASCLPQAWSSAAALNLITGLLGIEIDLLQNRIAVRPAANRLFSQARLSGLPVGDGRLDLTVRGAKVDSVSAPPGLTVDA